MLELELVLDVAPLEELEDDEELDDFPLVPPEVVFAGAAAVSSSGSGSSPSTTPCAHARREREPTTETTERKSVDCFIATCVEGAAHDIQRLEVFFDLKI